MITLPDREAISHVLSTALPIDLRAILEDIITHTAANELLDLTEIIVVEPEDLIDDVIDEIGSSPLVNPGQGLRWNKPGFVPYWAHLRERGSYIELVDCIGNSGFARLLLIDRRGRGELVQMVESHLEHPE